MALITGKPLLHLLLHPIILQCLRKLTEYPFTGRLILNTINVGRKLHFLVFIIDKKDSLIYRAQRKGPSVCPDLRGGVWETGNLPICLAVFTSLLVRYPILVTETGYSHPQTAAHSAHELRESSPSFRNPGLWLRLPLPALFCLAGSLRFGKSAHTSLM